MPTATSPYALWPLPPVNGAKQAGVADFISPEMPGSADAFLPDHPDRDQLFAVKIARDCGTEPACGMMSQSP
ncbi:MAG: hypothetical protein ACOCXM_11665 [Myxococcota bacterium]